MLGQPLIVAYGGGLNSTAMLVEFAEKGISPDLILFADTGGEKPETYAYRDLFSRWLLDRGMGGIITVQNDGMYGTLEKNCLDKQMLPSIAYGWKSCSEKYKHRPQNKYVNNWQPARICWAEGGKITKAIGYGIDEMHRAKIHEDDKYRYWHPLIEWQWARQDCKDAIMRVGLPVPLKSACFFCPSSTKSEVLRLRAIHPDLFDRAVAMEDNAAPNLQTVKGLGRRYAWKELVVLDEKQCSLFRDYDEDDLPCGCFDGGGNDDADE